MTAGNWIGTGVILAAFAAIGGAVYAYNVPDETPPHMADVCTDWTTTTQFAFMPTGVNGQMMMMPIIPPSCVRTEPKCVWGEEYTGRRVCL